MTKFILTFQMHQMLRKYSKTEQINKKLLQLSRAQMLMKSRLAGAQKGHGLLKKKADALQVRFRMILGKIIEVITSNSIPHSPTLTKIIISRPKLSWEK